MKKQISKEKEIAIEIKNVSKTFKIASEQNNRLKSYFVNPFHKSKTKKFDAVSDFSLTISKGDFIGIIGRNGSGKSTLLKMIAGIYEPDKGKISVNGKIVPFLELGVGFNPELSGRENVFLNGTILGMTRKFVESKFDEIVDFAEIREFIDVPLKNYSSGMVVRLAFAISIHTDADIFLMDEVLAVGDTNFQGKCIDVFLEHKKKGKTIVLITHDVSVVEKYCNKGVVLDHGEIVYAGSSKDAVIKYTELNIQKHNSALKDPIVVNEENSYNAEIKSVLFMDENHKPKGHFKTGDDLLVQVNFIEKLRPNELLNFGVVIYNSANLKVFGVNSFYDKVDIEKARKGGRFEILYKSLKLKSDSYYLRITFWGSNASQVYYVMPNSQVFTVTSTTQNSGIVELDYQWN